MNDTFEKIKKQITKTEKSGIQSTGNVPYEVWKMSNDIIMDNLERIYSILNKMQEDPGFSMDIKIGEIQIKLNGSSGDKSDIMDRGEKVITNIMQNLKDVAMDITNSKLAKVVKKNDESNKGFV